MWLMDAWANWWIDTMVWQMFSGMTFIPPGVKPCSKESFSSRSSSPCTPQQW